MNSDPKLLSAYATDWAVTHGLVMRAPKTESESTGPLFTHAPFALYPSPFPRDCFNFAKLIQTDFNLLVHRISRDHTFLSEVIDEVIHTDSFTGSLWQIFQTVEKEGIAQPVSLGIHRSDYLIHQPDDRSPPILQQVEVNTISASFSSLSHVTGELHRHLTKKLGLNYEIPITESFTSVPDGLAEGWKLYGNKEAAILFIVQEGEKNLSDQRYIEFNLLERHGISVIRKTLREVDEEGVLDPKTKELKIAGRTISVAYYRAGYTPNDYPTDNEWRARLTIERSLAIKCPTIGYHLSGLKKIQQIVAIDGVLEKFLDNEACVRLRKSFTGLYAVKDDIVEKVIKNPQNYVLKPQREGGGNNYYDEDIVKMLKKLSTEERKAYILMERIKPKPLKNTFVRNSVLTEAEVVSELGIYGIFIAKGNEVLYNKEGGHLLRTKSSSVNEGGVAAGYAHMDSCYFSS